MFKIGRLHYNMVHSENTDISHGHIENNRILLQCITSHCRVHLGTFRNHTIPDTPKGTFTASGG